ncbi:MAG: zinc ribbon domain-containing protein [Desulfobacterales bacterium]|nr:zinc ribbon domain-containing protein [Desulfobacterales bacterium]
MPIYEFVCKDCHHEFETLVSISDKDRPQCPKCNSGQVKKKLSACGIRPHGIPAGAGGFTPPACSTSG